MSNSIKELIGKGSSHGEGNSATKKVLIIAANPSVSERTGWPIGAWAAELTHPYVEFQKAGYEITIASPNGGKVEFDGFSDPRDESGYSANDLVSLGFIHTPQLIGQLDDTPKLSNVDPTAFDAIFLVGGQSPMYTYKGNQDLMNFVSNFYESGKPTAVVCHATCILLDTTLSDGRKLVEGKTWTGFADGEEQIADQFVGQKIQPFWIESEARKMDNTNFQVQAPFTAYAIKDGNLITGQQQNSGGVAAELVIEALEG
ncbi:MAG: type 1 glutamine amidotransferase domain-containing protein [Saprospiraceae bacterium]|nr:type 1 glutamine amidotransferase domain-containing protein [Saprospiraceae bacterium]